MSKRFELGDIRNRIVERRMMKPSELLDHPSQWRDHSEAQADSMAGILREIGITDTIKAWYSERAGGALVTWDGHLRKSLDPSVEWPVDITDLTDAEADYALATHDPVSAMAMTNAAALDALLSSISSGNEAVQKMFADVAAKAGLYMTTETDLDDLANTYGEPGEQDFWPVIKVKVAPATKQKFDDLMTEMPGHDEASKFDALISRGN